MPESHEMRTVGGRKNRAGAMHWKVGLYTALAGGVLLFWRTDSDPGEVDQEETPSAAFEDPQTTEEVLNRIQWSEDVIGLLRRATEALKVSVLNLELPDASAREHFAPQVTVLDLGKPRDVESPHGALESLLGEHAWSVAASEQEKPRETLALWKAMFEGIDFFESASFKVVRGRFDAGRSYATDVKFSGQARLMSGHTVDLSGHLDLHWVYGPRGQKKKNWRIDRWKTLDLHETIIARPLFKEVLEQALPSETTRRDALRSIHQEKIVDYFLDPELEKPAGFQAAAWDRHPGLSVVDIDGDGFDDLYVMARWGSNQLLINRGDGTFVEEAAKYGLDLEDHASSAIFADFDNDGDPDAIIGRTLGRSRYLTNEGGRFVDRADRVDGPLPYLASSVSASDIDRDGLLDAYISTYAAATIQNELAVATAAPVTDALTARAQENILGQFLSSEQSARLGRIFAEDANLIRNRPGPPNVLLRNVGRGRFVRGADSHPLAVWKNTYQATFFDYDDDGDADVYVANDFAPNVLFESDASGGFIDITAKTNTADIGFGMGAAAGDFDVDGDFDLYVSNMFTKAGRRITAQAPSLDERFKMMTRGNSLLQNGGSRFERVSGLEPPHILVEGAGWSWGGQFFDFNNDSYLDIYAPSGYYSAPREIAIPVDT